MLDDQAMSEKKDLPYLAGINRETGEIDLYKMLPEQGDSVMVINCGDHFEVRQQHFEVPPTFLTEEDLEFIRQGRIVWN